MKTNKLILYKSLTVALLVMGMIACSKNSDKSSPGQEEKNTVYTIDDFKFEKQTHNRITTPLLIMMFFGDEFISQMNLQDAELMKAASEKIVKLGKKNSESEGDETADIGGLELNIPPMGCEDLMCLLIGIDSSIDKINIKELKISDESIVKLTEKVHISVLEKIMNEAGVSTSDKNQIIQIFSKYYEVLQFKTLVNEVSGFAVVSPSLESFGLSKIESADSLEANNRYDICINLKKTKADIDVPMLTTERILQKWIRVLNLDCKESKAELCVYSNDFYNKYNTAIQSVDKIEQEVCASENLESVLTDADKKTILNFSNQAKEFFASHQRLEKNMSKGRQ